MALPDPAVPAARHRPAGPVARADRLAARSDWTWLARLAATSEVRPVIGGARKPLGVISLVEPCGPVLRDDVQPAVLFALFPHASDTRDPMRLTKCLVDRLPDFVTNVNSLIAERPLDDLHHKFVLPGEFFGDQPAKVSIPSLRRLALRPTFGPPQLFTLLLFCRGASRRPHVSTWRDHPRIQNRQCQSLANLIDMRAIVAEL